MTAHRVFQHLMGKSQSGYAPDVPHGKESEHSVARSSLSSALQNKGVGEAEITVADDPFERTVEYLSRISASGLACTLSHNNRPCPSHGSDSSRQAMAATGGTAPIGSRPGDAMAASLAVASLDEGWGAPGGRVGGAGGVEKGSFEERAGSGALTDVPLPEMDLLSLDVAPVQALAIRGPVEGDERPGALLGAISGVSGNGGRQRDPLDGLADVAGPEGSSYAGSGFTGSGQGVGGGMGVGAAVSSLERRYGGSAQERRGSGWPGTTNGEASSTGGPSYRGAFWGPGVRRHERRAKSPSDQLADPNPNRLAGRLAHTPASLELQGDGATGMCWGETQVQRQVEFL